MDEPGWRLSYDGFEPGQEGLREALCTLGNGYFATRGAGEESSADGVHYPGTYLAGGYNRLKTEIAGRVVENEDLVNLPNWLPLKVRIEGDDWLGPRGSEIVAYRQSLDMARGVLERSMTLRDAKGRRIGLASRRLVHMGSPHLGAIQLTVTAENWSGHLEIQSSLDGRVQNTGIARYRDLASGHLTPITASIVDPDLMLLVAETNQSHLRVAEAARTRLWRDGTELGLERGDSRERDWVGQILSCEIDPSAPLTIEKAAALFTSRDHAISAPQEAAVEAVRQAPRFESLEQSHADAWAGLWQRCDIDLANTPERTQTILRLHIFHLLQTVSPNTVDLDVGVPARGWHGEAYRGHIFWDELFIFPFLNFRLPEITRALLLYRYRRLGQARQAAHQAGYRGAMFPWQSGSSGREETQVLHLNPRSGRWSADNTHLQRHVSAAVAYNVWRYWQSTHDHRFLSDFGAEMLIDIARFWASIAVFNDDIGRFEIRGVMGPDEFHDRYPWREEPGLDNNAYTNFMAAWVLRRAVEVFDRIGFERRRELERRLELDPSELARWDEVSRKLKIAMFDGDIIAQFEGYDRLEEFDWDGYRDKYGDIQRLDRILEAEGDSVNRFKASKQADLLMLFYLFSAPELREQFELLGYRLGPDTIARNIDYYISRTSNGSTLSRVVHSWILASSDRTQSWSLFDEALESDVADIQGGTTAEGIHLGAMAGTLDLVQRGHIGLEFRDDTLWVNPCLAPELESLGLKYLYRGSWLYLRFDRDKLSISAPHPWRGPERIGVGDTTHAFRAGEVLELECPLTAKGLRPASRAVTRAARDDRDKVPQARDPGKQAQGS